MKRLRYRRVHQKGTFGITEIEFNDKGIPIKYLEFECGLLSYWLTPTDLRTSYIKLFWAFFHPILDLDNWPNEYIDRMKYIREQIPK